MVKKIKLEFTEKQLESFISLIETIEGMYGCSEDASEGLPDFDIEARKEIKNIDRMFKMNGYTRKSS
jgi:Zn-finger domain-containing protein